MIYTPYSTLEEQRVEFINSLKKLADFFASNEEITLPLTSTKLSTILEDEDTKESYWIDDPLAPPVTFPTWMEEDAIAIFTDGDYMDTSQWPLTTMPGENRPIIEISIEWEDRSALVMLASHAMAPSVWLDGEGTEPLTPIDLDAAGQTREEW